MHCLQGAPLVERPRAVRGSCRQVRAHAEAEESTSGRTEGDDDSDDSVAVPSALTGNSKFAAVLQAALKRSGGAEVLTSGEPAKKEAGPPCATPLFSSLPCGTCISMCSPEKPAAFLVPAHGQSHQLLLNDLPMASQMPPSFVPSFCSAFRLYEQHSQLLPCCQSCDVNQSRGWDAGRRQHWRRFFLQRSGTPDAIC